MIRITTLGCIAISLSLIIGCGGGDEVADTSEATTGENTTADETPPKPPKNNPPVEPVRVTGEPISANTVAELKLSAEYAGLVAQLADEETSDAASDALIENSSSAIDALTKALRHPDPKVRAGVAFTLGRMGADASGATGALKTQIESESDDAAKSAMEFAVDAIENPE